MNKMLKKSLVALILIACVVPPFLIGGIAMDILVGAITALAAVEIASLEDGKRHYTFAVVIFAAVELMTYTEDVTVSFSISMWLFFLFCCDLASEKMTTDRIAYTFIMSMILMLAWRGVDRICIHGFNGLMMLFVGIACYMCDTGAYFIGSFFGKHKMNPRLSPHKTWEGAIGGYAVAVVCALLWGFLVIRSKDSSGRAGCCRKLSSAGGCRGWRSGFFCHQAQMGHQGLRLTAAGTWRHPGPD